MKAYPAYKDSGVEWIGEIPEGWQVTKLKHVATINPERDKFNQNQLEQFVVFLPMERVHSNGSYDTSIKKTIRELWNGFTYFQQGDVILAKITPCFENGKSALLNYLESNIGFGSTEFHVLRKIENTSSKFIFYIVKSHLFMTIGEAFMTGAAGQKRVPTDFVRGFKIGFPSYVEQQAIANYLDRQTQKLDRLIALKEKKIKLLKEYRAALINQAVTKGLNPHVKMKDSGIEWLGQIPEHWEVIKLGFIGKLTLGKMLTPENKGGYTLKPYLRAKNILWGKVDIDDIKTMWFSENELSQYKITINDLLVSEGGEVGRTAIWQNELEECYIQNSVHKISFQKKYSPFFFLYQFIFFGSFGHFDAIVDKVSIGHLTKEKLVKIKLIVPPLPEQQAIASFLDKKTQELDKNIENAQAQITQLKEYRTALISAAVTGKIDVRDEV